MICERLTRNIDNRCGSPARKFEQRLVLIPYDDILSYVIDTSNDNHSAEFYLLPTYSGGHHIVSNANGDNISASFNMSRDENIPRYTHTVNFPIIGIEGKVMNALRKIDATKYVAVLRFGDGTIKIYGLENGLKSTGYSYTPQSRSGGGRISLKSDFTESFQPFEYSGDKGNFDNDFNNPVITLTGDYNDDYNDSYAQNFYL